MGKSRQNQRFRVRTDELARLCGCGDQSELIDSLRQFGQEFSAQGAVRERKSVERREDAKALKEWYDEQEFPESPPLVKVAVVSTASRPGPLDTPSKPKALLKVGEATLLTHCLRGICRAGVRHVVLVLGGPASEAISRHLSEMSWKSYFKSLRIVDLGASYSSGHAASLLAAARVLLGSQKPRPFLLVGVDHVYHHDILRRLVENGTEGSAGVVLVETDRDVISSMKLHTNSNTVRVVLGDDFLVDDESKQKDKSYFYASSSPTDQEGFSMMNKFYGGDSGDDEDADDDNEEESDDEPHSSWVRQIGRNLRAYNGIEAGAFVLSPRVFDAMRGLARAEPYFTLAEALSKFCVKNAPSQLRAAHTRGLPWIAIESTEQQSRNSGSSLFKFRSSQLSDDEAGPGGIRYLGVALPVEVVPESQRTGIFDIVGDKGLPAIELTSDHEQQHLKAIMNEEEIPREEESETTADSQRQQWRKARKVSSSSLAALLESFQDEEEEDEEEEDLEENTGILLANSDAGRGALAIFEQDLGRSARDSTTAATDVEEGRGYEIHRLKRRHVVPQNDIDKIRMRVLTSEDKTEPPKLALRIERKTPPIGWIVLVVACFACSSTSAFTRTLNQAVSGTLRSFWRQTITTGMLCVIELVKSTFSQHSAIAPKDNSSRSTKDEGAWKAGADDKATSSFHQAIGKKPDKKDARRSESCCPRTRALFARGCCFTLRGRELLCEFFVNGEASSSAQPIAKANQQAADAKTPKSNSGIYSLREQWAVILVVALGFAIQNMALSVAFVFVPTAIALTLVNSTPIWLVAHSVFFTNKPAAPIVIFGAFVGFVGAIVLCAAEMSSDSSTESTTEPAEDPSTTSSANPLIGVIIGALGGFGGAIYFKAAKHAKGVTPLRLLLFSNAGACFFSFAVSYHGGARGLYDPEHGFLGWIEPSNRINCLRLSLIVDCVGMLGVLLALRFVDPLIVTVSLQLEPVLAAVLDSIAGVGTLSSMNLATIVGSIIVFSGCAIVVSSNSSSKDDIDASEALEPVHSQKQR